ncbi:hypothetical protein BCR32DRAFT_271161 [Anaeromyces robustus]|uniref:Uncharacterized protein n=1 Tax=Anaeromyces robustus TaxID=1754192 RepID=A0A1Y1WTB2_9FUNG|nr:hypothetical protein BCR32DRAFT_271161 [Anaeromyces robustus]|eukprot:ORX76635.1 hypothetical protein BCR32DRAFT_271161 [Anaeromyces robustus]
MEAEYESVPLRILELFKFYLSDQEIKSVIASCPKTDWTLNGWLPVDTLISFKRVKAVTTDKNEILNILVNQGNDFIEFTSDYQYLRRKSPFSPATIPQKKPINCSLEVFGFTESVTPIEIQTIFSKYGGVENISFGNREGTYIVDFYEVNSFVNSLITPITYEDQRIHVRTIRKQGVEIVKSKLPKAYPANKVAQFGPVEENVQKEFIKQAFEQYAQVSYVDFDYGNKFGYVKFKQSVAKELVNIVFRNGGITVRGMEEKLDFHPLEGDEEYVYWQLEKIKKEKNLYSQERTINPLLLKTGRLTKKEKQRIKREKLRQRQKQNRGNNSISKNDKSKIKSSLFSSKLFDNSNSRPTIKDSFKRKIRMESIDEMFKSLSVVKNDDKEMK